MTRHINFAQNPIEKAKRKQKFFSPRKRSDQKSEANKANSFFKIETNKLKRKKAKRSEKKRSDKYIIGPTKLSKDA